MVSIVKERPAFLTHWPRKVTALFAALLIWFSVNQSISTSRTFSDIPVRLLNLPADREVVGLLDNGQLSQRVTLTLKGTRKIIEGLHAKDLEVQINAEGREEGWTARIDKRMLSSLSPEVDLQQHLSEVSPNEIFIPMHTK